MGVGSGGVPLPTMSVKAQVAWRSGRFLTAYYNEAMAMDSEEVEETGSEVLPGVALWSLGDRPTSRVAVSRTSGEDASSTLYCGSFGPYL